MPNSAKWKIGWGITNECNMRCKFCYSASVRAGRTTLPDIGRLLAFVETNAAQIDSINWGTGENALSPTWFELISAIRHLAPHIDQAVTSNGYLGCAVRKNEQHLRAFIEAIDEVDVSLDYATPDLHNDIRGHASAFEWVQQTVRLCQASGKHCTVVMVGTVDTLVPANIDNLFNLAREWNCALRINVLRPTKGVKLQPASYEQIKTCMRWAVAHHRIISLCDPLFGSLFDEHVSDPSGISSLRILPNGAITPSTYLIDERWRAANVYVTTPRLERLGESAGFSSLASSPVPRACDRCNRRDACQGGCKDRRWLWYRSLEERDPYCPDRFHDECDWLGTGAKRFFSAGRSLAHDGYLPTVIFMPS